MNELLQIVTASAQRAPWGWALTGMVALALIRIWPAMSKQAIEARAQLRKEKREDLNDCHARLDIMQASVDTLLATVADLKINLNGAISAYRMLDVELEYRDAGCVALKQARAIMSTAFSVSPSTQPGKPL